jgi:hypothetical protein
VERIRQREDSRGGGRANESAGPWTGRRSEVMKAAREPWRREDKVMEEASRALSRRRVDSPVGGQYCSDVASEQKMRAVRRADPTASVAQIFVKNCSRISYIVIINPPPTKSPPEHYLTSRPCIHGTAQIGISATIA